MKTTEMDKELLLKYYIDVDKWPFIPIKLETFYSMILKIEEFEKRIKELES